SRSFSSPRPVRRSTLHRVTSAGPGLPRVSLGNSPVAAVGRLGRDYRTTRLSNVATVAMPRADKMKRERYACDNRWMYGQWGLTVPLAGVPLGVHAPLLAELADVGYTDVWSSEVAGTDAFTPLALASTWAPTLRLGTAIAPVLTRGPGLLAM